MYSTIKQNLATGYVLDAEGAWVSVRHGRATPGGNVNIGNMKASLELPRLEALARVRGVTLAALLPEVVEAAQFVGAYMALNVAQPYEYQEDGEGTPDDDYVRDHVAKAAEITDSPSGKRP